VVTKGHRRLGRTIRILENSVELSPKESYAREDESKYKTKVQSDARYPADSPVQNLREVAAQKKDKKEK
jgi:hypothetical protein